MAPRYMYRCPTCKTVNDVDTRNCIKCGHWMHSTSYPPQIVKVSKGTGALKATSYTILIIVILFGIMAYIAQQQTQTTTTTETEDVPTTFRAPASTTTATNAEPEVDETGSEDEESTAMSSTGDTVVTENFTITLEETDKSNGTDMFQPKEGMEFVYLTLVVENNADAESTVSSLLMFNAYQDGFVVNESIEAHAASLGADMLNATLPPGKKIRGKLAYEVPKEWEEIEVNINLSLLNLDGKDKAKILINNEAQQ